MVRYQSLSQTKWGCKYHIVGIPKYRKEQLYAELRKLLGEVFRELASSTRSQES